MSSQDPGAVDTGNILPEGVVRTTRTSGNQPQSSTILTGHTSRARMSQHWEQVSPVRYQALSPPALPAQPTATSLAGRENGNDQGDDNVAALSDLSDNEEARLIAELGQIRISIDNQTENIDQCSNWRATIKEVAQDFAHRLNQIEIRFVKACAPAKLRAVLAGVKSHLRTAQTEWKRRAEQVPEEGDQADQEQQEREQPPAVDGITPIQEGTTQDNDGEALPLNEGGPELSLVTFK